MKLRNRRNSVDSKHLVFPFQRLPKEEDDDANSDSSKISEDLLLKGEVDLDDCGTGSTRPHLD